MLFRHTAHYCTPGPRQIYLWAFLLLAGLISVSVSAQVNVLTYHNDNSRTGQNLNETALVPANVNFAQFGRLFSVPVDGYIFTQPLYMSAVSIPGKGTHNVVFVATEHDSVYAFDADSNTGANAAPLWQTSFINAANGVTTVSTTDINCADTGVELGITGTPVIDGISGTLYVVAVTKENGVFFQRLHALDVTTGLDKPGSPVVITGAVPGNGDGNVNGVITFDPLREHQHPALLLSNGVVYIAWASHGDNGTYHGWVMGYNATTLAQTLVYNTTPNASTTGTGSGLGGIWMGGGGPAADATGNIYFISGNGASDPATGDYGDSFVKLSTTGIGPVIADYFMPFDIAFLYNEDVDLGSGGALLLPTSVGTVAHPHLMVGAGKEGTIYLLDCNGMGGFNLNGIGPDNTVQSLPGALGNAGGGSNGGTGAYGTPAYFNGSIYYGGQSDTLKAFGISSGHVTISPTSQSPTAYGYLGSTPSISANGSSGGVVWALERDNFVSTNPAVLHAYDAANLSTELYNSSQYLSRDNPGPTVKFQVPTVANGKVYVGTQTQLSVFGPVVLPPPPAGVLLATAEQIGAFWKYTIATPAANWFATAFNDAAWTSGVAGFGTTNFGGSVSRTAWTATPGDIWIRRHFTITGSVPRNQQFRVFHDEGCEIYLNGVLAGSATGYTTSYTILPMNAAGQAALQVGDNVIAVHCHQSTGGQYIDVGIQAPVYTISGIVSLQSVLAGNFAQSLVFTLTPSGTTAGSVLIQTVTLAAADGSFTLTGVPAGTYTLSVKGSKWLQRNIAVTVGSANVTGLALSLLGGDLNDDNQISFADFVVLRNAYGSNPASANWNPSADINCDGQVSLADFILLRGNYGKSGDIMPTQPVKKPTKR